MFAPVLLLALAVGPAVPSPSHFEKGVEALKAKNAPAAITELSACVKDAPERADCQWELGWAHWLKADYANAIASWERVEKLEPSHPKLKESLDEARAQLAFQQKLKNAPVPVKEEKRASPKGAALRIRAAGDTMLGTDFPAGYLPPEDGAQMLAGVKDWLLDADLTFVNLEGPLCDAGTTNKCGKGDNCYAFRCPTRYGRFLKEAGIDLASTANNHSGDFGELCRRQTEATLDTLGIKWSGPPGSIAYAEHNGTRVAMVAFHTSAATNDVNDLATAKALVRKAKENADLVFVSFHGGAEGASKTRVPEGSEMFFGENRGDLRAFTHAVVDAGADLVLGHGPHVIRGAEVYKDRLVLYSLGNFATYGRFNIKGPTAVGMIVDITLEGSGRFLTGRVLPTRLMGEGVPVKDPNREAIDILRKLSSLDFPKTGVAVDEDGTLHAASTTAQSPMP